MQAANEKAPIWSYITDGTRLMEVTEADSSHVVCESVMDDGLVLDLGAQTLAQHWRRVRPTAD